MRKYCRFILAALFALGLLAFPAQSLYAAQAAIYSWAMAVAPALFPFMVVLPYLTCHEACVVYNKLFGALTRHVFALPGAAASAIVTGLASGSPAGAMAVVRVARREGMTVGEAARMAGIACGVGPIYVVSGIGVALAGSAAEGWRLATSQLAALFLTGILFRGLWKGAERCPEAESEEGAEARPISRAVLSILKVGGYMTMFAVGIALMDAVLGSWCDILSLALDLPTGAAYALAVGTPRALVALAVGFAGLCIAAQNMGLLRAAGVTWGKYLAQKAVTAVLTAGLYLAQTRLAASRFFAYAPRGSEFEAATAGILLLMLPVTIGILLTLFRKSRVRSDN